MTHDLLSQVGGQNPFDDLEAQQQLKIKTTGQSDSSSEIGGGNPFDKLFKDEKENDPLAYMDIYDKLKEKIKHIENNTIEVLNLNSKLKSVTSNKEITKLTKRLDNIIDENYKLNKIITNELKQEKVRNDKLAQDKKYKEGSSIVQWRINQLNSCTKNFQLVSQDFSNALNIFQDTINDQTRRQIHILKTDEMTDEDIDKLISNPEAAQKFVQQSLQMEDMNDDMLDHLVGLENKLKGITKLVKSLEELQLMWNELNSLITEQQELLDSIETNVEQTHNFIGEAVDNLRDGEKYQKRARKYRFCLFCLVLVILLIIGGSVAGFATS